jgi:hypothetical protein
MAPDSTAIADRLATGAVVFGLVSLVVCWLFPFGPLLGVAGAVAGLLAMLTGRAGERALVGTALAAIGAGTGLLLAWDYWRRVLGL